jgi:hypothetical protein
MKDLNEERQQFAADLQLARKMKRLYPEMFRPEALRKEQISR